VRSSFLEQVCAALIDQDEALWQAREDLERARTLAADWEAEVVAVRRDNLELHSLLRGARAQQSQAEERARALEQKAKEADDLKAALDAKASSCRSVPPARGLRGSSSRSGLPLRTPGRR
jgi:predicted  nucleic acid-binding Zn-ribbon protein